MRHDGRAADALRAVRIDPNYLETPDGSALISTGRTRVLCTAMIQVQVPPWMMGRGTGWVTGEYAMLPGATTPRSQREGDRLSGRTHEIRRMIGRSLRAAVNLELLGERMVVVDCDVLQADGGTRTASITGGYVALCLALKKLVRQGAIPQGVFRSPVAAVSVGLAQDVALLDLDYSEDSQAQVDMNLVMNAAGEFIEVQGAAEHGAFPRGALDALLALGQVGITELLARQAEILAGTLEVRP
jgi:ribonuclease PH